MKRSLLIGLVIAFSFIGKAQVVQTQEEFERLSAVYEQEYKQQVDKYNAEFTLLLKETWSKYVTEKAVLRPSHPKPAAPLHYSLSLDQKGTSFEVESIVTLQGEVKGEADGAQSHVFSKNKRLKPIIKSKKKDVQVVSDESSAVAHEQRPKTNVEGPVSSKIASKEELKKKGNSLGGGQMEVIVKTSSVPEVSFLSKKSPNLSSPKPNRMNFKFYGVKVSVDNALKKSFSLKGITPEIIGDVWEQLSRKSYQKIVTDCSQIKQHLLLNDWGMVLLTRKIAALYTRSKNEQVLLQFFLLAQCGYKTRLARLDTHLVLLMSTDCQLYACPYLNLGGTRYYQITKAKGHTIYTYRKDYAKAKRRISMLMKKTPLLMGDLKRTQHRAKAYPEVNISTCVSADLMAYYNDFPQCDFSVYSSAPMSEMLAETILPILDRAIQGKNDIQAANLLLNFVQTGFKYKTDDEQFRYEKPFFADELFFYPYCDCEDRAILYTYLVRKLLHLDTVLVDYPGHIATAVRFRDTSLKGDYINVQGERYYICDPTYINAKIAKAMPSMASKRIKVLKY